MASDDDRKFVGTVFHDLANHEIAEKDGIHGKFDILSAFCVSDFR